MISSNGENSSQIVTVLALAIVSLGTFIVRREQKKA
ncbi:MAG: LPXTG cell wall anchor domain-containing protein [Chloroflexi bacterium]|nr:LPXTG cell wall anchor domain-containing protein [Chloroflexota bacterium]MBP7041547.1 LPXTG cell wall anchor domain-containing protein [Chloroflexota bacterium]